MPLSGGASGSRHLSHSGVLALSCEWLRKGLVEFPREGLSESAALGLFIILNAVEDGLIPVNRAEFYASQCAVHPGLPARLPVYLQAFEVHRLRHGGRFAEALGLAMRQARQLPRASGHGTAYPLLEELGKWLAKDPKALPDGLPAMREPEWRPAQAAFMRGLLYPGENNLIFSKDRGWADKYDLFNRMARSQDWVEAALHAGEQSFYHMRMARDGHLADAVLTHERDGDTMSMNALGGLLPASRNWRSKSRRARPRPPRFSRFSRVCRTAALL